MVTREQGNVYVGVVDDDESLRRSLARLLRAAGMQPIAYASAEAFRADLKQPRFDCLVLDVQMGVIPIAVEPRPAAAA
jgi:FixJ family two-component response regulator